MLYSIKKIKNADNVKNTLVAKASQQLRSPVNSLIDYPGVLLETAEQGFDLQRLREELTKIAETGQSILNTMDFMLELTDASIDKPLVLEKFNIRDEIQRNLFILEPIILRNHNKFTVQCPNAMLCMYSDPKRVIKILINIISKLSSITHENIITLSVKPKKLGDMDAIEFKIN